jgi:hypothetical protein
MTLLLAVSYFVDVFVGMFLLHKEYNKTDLKGAITFENDRRFKEFMIQPYNPIEIGILGFMLLENLIKLVYTTKNN